MSDEPQELAQALYGCTSLMVQQVAMDPSSTPDVVLFHLAAKLGRFLVSRPTEGTRLDIVWRGRGWSIGAEWQSTGPGPQPLSAERRAAHEARLAEPPAEHEKWQPISVWWWGEHCDALRIALSQDPDKGALEIRYTGAPGENERWSWFVMYVRGLRELHHIVHGLMAARVSILRERYNTDVQALRNAWAVPLQETLAQARALLPKLLDIGATELVEEMLTSLVLHMFGTGWRVRTVRQHVPGATELDASGTLVRELVDQVLGHARSAGAANKSRVLGLADCLDAAISPTGSPISEAASAGDEMLAMLAMWTRAHELLRGLKRTPSLRPDAEIAWAAVKDKTLPLLLARLAKPLVDGAPLVQARNWLIMWFCLELLNPREPGAIEDADSWDDVRVELAYALRETVRHDLLGARVDYFHDASMLVSAVAYLVEYHATRLVGIPSEYGVNNLMRLLGADGSKCQSALEHLQHVTDIYIAGHFLLSVQIRREGKNDASAAELLANAAAEDVIANLRRAFSMAVIFHDVGLILLPSDAALSQGRVLKDDDVRAMLQTRGDATRAHALDVTAKCIEQLGLGRGEMPAPRGLPYFDTQKERERLAAYFEHQAEDGHFNHGLLGAWYLDRVCMHAEQRSWKADAVMQDCRKMAVRAILLHDVVCAEIDPDRDPIAALLVTCNEVFDWSPARQAMKGARTLEKLPYGARANTPTSRVDRSIEIRDFAPGRASGDAALRFETVIASRDGTWPVVVVTLMAPEYLDVPVYRIWLAKAQAMGRIKPGRESGFAPALWIRSAPDPHFRHCGLTARAALKRALSEAKQLPEIVDWCSSVEHFPNGNGHNGHNGHGGSGYSEPVQEEVRLGYLTKRICEGDIEDELPDIIRMVDDYIESVEVAQRR